MLATISSLRRALFGKILAHQSFMISDRLNVDDLAELLRSFQPPSDFGCADEDDVGVKTAATFEDRNTVGLQMILRL
jgi:hypothetical protein